MTTTIGVDVGGTNIAVGTVDHRHRVLERAKGPTPDGGPDDVLDEIVRLIRSLDAEPEAVGVGIPGVVHEGTVLGVPNLPRWCDDVDLAGALRSRLGVPIAIGNDANAGLTGEWLAGAAAGVRNALGVWLGTGIGGALILNGEPYTGSRGGAGEFGHAIVRAGGALCVCGRRGCVEAYAGRRSLERTAATMVDAGRTTALARIRDGYGKSALTAKVWRDALEQGDALACELFDEALEALGIAAGSALNLLDLDLVVVGGGLAQKLGQPLADRLAAAAAPWTLRGPTTFVAAALGDDSGLVGAAWWAQLPTAG